MQINKINHQNFGMDITAKESFWADINYQIWCEPENKNAKKLLKQIEKIKDYPLKDTYEIQKVSTTTKKAVKDNPFNTFDIFIQEGYKLINKTKNKVVLEQISNQPIKKAYNPEIKQTDFINTIVKNLKKLTKIEKL